MKTSVVPLKKPAQRVKILFTLIGSPTAKVDSLLWADMLHFIEEQLTESFGLVAVKASATITPPADGPSCSI
jgi:hypothetical protein